MFCGPDHDVLGLMLGPFSFSGTEIHNLGKEEDKRRPLLLDVIMEGLPRASTTSRLLALPAELLADIADLLDKPGLASLALVNSDCRQLARSVQFANLVFDYGPKSTLLAFHLGRESQKLAHDSRGPPSIGACVRSVTVASKPGSVAAMHPALYESVWGKVRESVPREQEDELREEARKYYFNIYRPLLVSALTIMPRLEVLSWHDSMALDALSLLVISTRPVQHLRLSKAVLEYADPKEMPSALPNIPLRSLHLDVRLTFDKEIDDGSKNPTASDITETLAPVERPDISVFCTNLLKRCAITLETLEWTHLGLGTSPDDTIPVRSGSKKVAFPRLRRLKLGMHYDATASMVESLLSESLTHLELPMSYNTQNGFFACERLPLLRDLDTLVFPRLAEEAPAVVARQIKFLSEHDHIQKLYIGDTADEIMDEMVMPCLSSHSFSHLRSLSLAWQGPWDIRLAGQEQENIAYIPERHLATIGGLSSLEQLCLSAGVSGTWRAQWLVDHAAVREHLAGLTHLKKLALCNDTYKDADTPLKLAESYYSIQPLWEGEISLIQERFTDLRLLANDADCQWELAHRCRMHNEADQYAEVLPSLDWMYCGQWRMEIKRSEVKWNVVPLSKERDSCYAFLENTFAFGTVE